MILIISGLSSVAGTTGAGKDISVKLENEELWRRFNELGTEMIITKTGRYCHLEIFL